MTRTRDPFRGVFIVIGLTLGLAATACSSSSGPLVGAGTSGSSGSPTIGADTSGSFAGTDTSGSSAGADTSGPSTRAASDNTGIGATASEAGGSGEISVAFDAPGASPRPLKETSVAIRTPTPILRMRVTDLTYRGVVCGFTFTGTRPASPVTIRIDGTTATGSFTSGAVELRWTADGTSSADAPASDNGWSFSADSYPSRNGAGWAVSIGAVTAEGENVVPTGVGCEVRSRAQFLPENGPVGYWAGFATR